MKSASTIALLCLAPLLAGCDEPKKWNPDLPGAHEGSSVGDHARPAADGKKAEAEPKTPSRDTGAPPPGGQTQPQIPTPPPAEAPAEAPKE